MKKYTLSLLLILGLVFQIYLPLMSGAESKTTQQIKSQKECFDMIAPFINKDTVLIAHVDLGQFNFDKLAEALKVQIRANMKFAQFDTKSAKATEKEFNIVLDRLISTGKPALNSFFKKTNLKNIFAVVPDIKQVQYSCIILPLSDKNEQQVKAIDDLLTQLDLPNIKFKENYILIPFDQDVIDDDELTLEDFYSKTFKPAKNIQLEQSFLNHPNQTLYIALSAFNLAQFVKENNKTDMFEQAKDLPIKIIPALTIIKESFDNVVLTLNLNTLGSSLEVGFSDQESATKMQKELVTIREELISFWIKELSTQMENENNPLLTYLNAFNVFPFVQAYINGVLNTQMPQLEKNKIIFISQSNEIPNITTVPIIGILSAFLLPVVQSNSNAGRHIQCTNNLKIIALAMFKYHDTYGYLPPAYKVDSSGKPLHSWRVLILPFVEQMDLYKKIRLDEPWDSEWNSQFHSQMPAIYGCAKTKKDSKKGLTHYSIIIGKETPFSGDKGVSFAAITDGTSNTIMVLERDKAVCWMDPNQELSYNELQKSNFQFSCTLHKNTGIAAYCDGSVRNISADIDPEDFKNAVNKNNGK